MIFKQEKASNSFESEFFFYYQIPIIATVNINLDNAENISEHTVNSMADTAYKESLGWVRSYPQTL